MALSLPHGARVDEAAELLGAELKGRRLLRIGAADLLRLSRCGFRSAKTAHAFQAEVVSRAFRGQYSHCSFERNPNIDDLLADARARRVPEEPILIHARNCTGNPDNAFNKPKVDVGHVALSFRPGRPNSAECGDPAAPVVDGAEQAIDETLSLYGGRFK